MLDLTASPEVVERLRALRDDDPDSYARVTRRITDVRSDPGGRSSGRSFIADGRTARLVTVFVPERRVEWAFVWILDETKEQPAVKVVALELTD